MQMSSQSISVFLVVQHRERGRGFLLLAEGNAPSHTGWQPLPAVALSAESPLLQPQPYLPFLLFPFSCLDCRRGVSSLIHLECRDQGAATRPPMRRPLMPVLTQSVAVLSGVRSRAGVVEYGYDGSGGGGGGEGKRMSPCHYHHPHRLGALAATKPLLWAVKLFR